MLNGWCKKNFFGAFQRINSKWKGDLERLLDLWKFEGTHFNWQCLYQIDSIWLLVWMDLAWFLQTLQDNCIGQDCWNWFENWFQIFKWCPLNVLVSSFNSNRFSFSKTNLFQFVDVTICRDNNFIVHLTLSKKMIISFFFITNCGRSSFKHHARIN
jgi:hypothetical protein